MNVRFNSDTSIDDKAVSFLADPLAFFERSFEKTHCALSRQELEEIQLAAMQQRFHALRDSVPMLKKLADEEGVDELKNLDDVVPLLFGHTIYKSYPSFLIDKKQFGQLTRWLNKLTTVDLSDVDVSGCDGIDSWIDTLDQQTDLRVCHSSGTTGTVSFLPPTEQETRKNFLIGFFYQFASAGVEPPREGHSLDMHIVNLGYRSGKRANLRSKDYAAEYIAGSEDRVHSLIPGSQSADLLYLAAKLQAAAAKGELDRLKIDPVLLARKAEFDQQQKDAAQRMGEFLDVILDKVRGERVYFPATPPQFWEFIERGRAKGLQDGVFSSESMCMSGGGNKGGYAPPDWEEHAKRFLGVSGLSAMYGMTEVTARNMLCSEGRYHIAPTAILYVLDPDTSEPLPRKGVQTGRAAFYDLESYTYWGGFITGDEVTVDWDTQCPCGQKSAHLARQIERFSVARGGDDKISCAAAPEAHETALNFLNQFS